MASPFARTMRSLTADNFKKTIIGLVGAIGILSTWCIWFFYSGVTIWKISSKLETVKNDVVVAKFDPGAIRVHETREQTVIALFAPENGAEIKPDQKAELHLNGDIGKKLGAIQAIVTNVVELPEKKVIQVELKAIIEKTLEGPLPEGITGQVRIGVGKTTPAELVMQASGVFNK